MIVVEFRRLVGLQSIILLVHLSVKDLRRGMDSENTVAVAKSFKKCVIVNAFDGIEDEVLFEEC